MTPDRLIDEAIENDIDFSIERKYESFDPGIKDWPRDAEQLEFEETE